MIHRFTTNQFFLLYIFIIVGSVFVRKLIDVTGNHARNNANMQVLPLSETENSRNIIIEEKNSLVDTTMENVDDDFNKYQLA